MKKYDTLAEDYVLNQLKNKNKTKAEFYAMKADSSTNALWDIVTFELIGKVYEKKTYQVKEVNFGSKNKSIQGDFKALSQNVDFLMIVIFNSSKGINKKEPIIFKIDAINNLAAKTVRGSNPLLDNGKWYYSSSERTISLSTLFTNYSRKSLKNFRFYNF